MAEREKEVSIVQSRLERLSKDIKHATSLRGATKGLEQSIHLQMLQAQRRRLLGEPRLCGRNKGIMDGKICSRIGMDPAAGGAKLLRDVIWRRTLGR